MAILEHIFRKPFVIENRSLRQFIRYGIMGVTGVALDALVYTSMLHLGYSVNVAKTVGILCSVVYAYIGNTLWSFETKMKAGTFVRFCVVYALSAVVNVSINGFTSHLLTGILPYPLLLAFFCATGVSVMITFFGLKFLVYRQ